MPNCGCKQCVLHVFIDSLNHADSLISIIPLSGDYSVCIDFMLNKALKYICIVNSYLKRHIYKTSFYNTYPIRAHTQCGLVRSRFNMKSKYSKYM